MYFKKFIKYFLVFVISTNSSMSLALNKDCGFVNNLENYLLSSLTINNEKNMCHEAIEEEKYFFESKVHDDVDCAECKFCSIINQFNYFNMQNEVSFFATIFRKKIELDSRFNSYIINPKGPPPKKIS